MVELGLQGDLFVELGLDILDAPVVAVLFLGLYLCLEVLVGIGVHGFLGTRLTN
jgi:hypothetical protein